jgi:outer membrane protein assembly factor BamB
MAASSTGVVSKIALDTGRLIWRTEIGTPLVAGVATGSGASMGMSAVITSNSELAVLDAEGKIARRIALGGVALEIPVLAGNLAIVRLSDNRIAGFDLSTGNRRWVIQRSLPPLVLHAQSGMRSASPPQEMSTSDVIGPGDVLANLPGGRLVWLDASTGAVRWESQVVTPRGSNEVERIIDLLGSATADGPDVCVAAYQTNVSCFGAENGRRIFSRDIGAASPLAANARHVFVADDQSRLFALSRKDGTTAWAVDAFMLRNLMHPLLRGRALWVADGMGYLHAVGADDGKMLARIQLDGGAISGAMRSVGGGILVQTQGGALMLIRTEG